MNKRNLFVRDLVAWIGFKSIDVEHDREDRCAGTTKAALRISVGSGGSQGDGGVQSF